jgi:uncharacterized protein (DUF1330 family)
MALHAISWGGFLPEIIINLGKEVNMKVYYRLAVALFAGATLGAAGIKGLQAQVKAPFYVVIDISEMLDADTYMKAVSAAEPNATMSTGGRLIIRSAKPVAVDGAPPPSRFAVIAFDTEEKAKSWSMSPAIKELNAVRMKTTKSRSFMVEGLTIK